MDKDNKSEQAVRKEMSSVLSGLRWLLTGFRLYGIEDWPVTQPEAAVDDLRPEEPEGLAQDRESSLRDVQDALGDCRRCRLHGGRTHIVFGQGSHRAQLVFVGEGPGFDEDRQGQPFVGRAGKLLNAMIRALGLQREEVYICNVVKCRPPDNRTPNPDEIEVCSQFLMQQLTALQPRVICALGACAAQTLLDTSVSISRLRGKAHLWRGVPLICTYHPAYLLRNPAQKASAWQDLLQIHHLLHSGQAPR